MPEKLIVTPSRSLACATLVVAMLLGADAHAQTTNPPPPPGGAAVNPMCPRLEAQLAMIDRGGGGDPAKDEQIHLSLIHI